MKKNEFLHQVVSRFLSNHAQWQLTYENRRSYTVCVTRQVAGILLHLSFCSRSDRNYYSQSVGWSPTAEALVELVYPSKTPPVRLRDGRLKRIETLESPRDFQHDALSVSTRLLYQPFSGFNADENSLESIATTMLNDISNYAMPYLSLMLHRRHGFEVLPSHLEFEEIPPRA